MHGFIEQMENMLVVGLLLLLGGAVVTGVLADLTWQGALIAVTIVAVIRPVSGHVSLIGTKLTSAERWTIAFFGIRGFGSVYYLSYALGEAEFEGASQVWAIVALTMLISIAAHGISATPAMEAVDRSAERG